MEGTPNPEKKPEEGTQKRRLYPILAVFDRILGYIMPIFYGIAMAYLLNPVVVFLTARFEPFFGKRCKTERKAKKISKVLKQPEPGSRS